MTDSFQNEINIHQFPSLEGLCDEVGSPSRDYPCADLCSVSDVDRFPPGNKKRCPHSFSPGICKALGKNICTATF